VKRGKKHKRGGKGRSVQQSSLRLSRILLEGGNTANGERAAARSSLGWFETAKKEKKKGQVIKQVAGGWGGRNKGVNKELNQECTNSTGE